MFISKNNDNQSLSATLVVTICVLMMSFSFSAHAEESGNVVDIISAKSPEAEAVDEGAHTHPPIRLTPDKSEIVTLSREAASIIVGNPNHLGVMADSSRRLVLVPRAPGASFFTVLDKEGGVIMQRHAIIASPKKKYVRVRRACAASTDENCQETRVFYCPDMCHEIVMNNGGDAASGSAAQAQAGATEELVEGLDDQDVNNEE